MSPAPVKVNVLEEGAVLHLILARPKGNILDAEMIAGLREALAAQGRAKGLRAVMLEGEGAHFSFGASVEEHLPGRVGEMLKSFHGLFRDLIALHRPLVAVVRGQCLGGGLELAAFCQRVVADDTARMGQPEIQLGVIAPVASLVLPRRVGQRFADDLLLTGRSIPAREAMAMGLVDVVTQDPQATALTWIREHLISKSASALRFAVEAARYEFHAAFLEHIDQLEGLYVDRLMALQDPLEGLTAFLERRTPAWTHA